MDKYHIALTPDEKSLLSQIDLRDNHANHEEAHKAHNANKTPLLALLKSLAARDGIPEVRRRYWNDPEYNTGRVKSSHKGLFERNRNTGEDIYTHPHFLEYFRYFLYGTDLPDAVIASFEAKVGNPEWVTSSDIVPIGKHARDLMRQYHLPRSAPEEFFKLVLDMRLGLSTASHVRQSAMRAR